MPDNLVEMINGRIGSEFDGEAHFSEAEARSIAAEIERLEADLAAKHHQFLYEAEKHSEWLEKFMAMKARAEAAEALCDKLAEALKTLRSAFIIAARSAGYPENSIEGTVAATRESLEQVGKR